MGRAVSTVVLSSVLAAGACSGDDGGTAGGSAGSAGTGSASGAGGMSGAGGLPTSGGSAGLGGGGGPSGGAGSGGTSGDSGGTPDAAGDAALVAVTLLDQKGPVFTPTSTETMKKLSFGTKGTTYGWVRVQFDVTVGDYQPELPDEGDPDRTEHILFGLFRANQPSSYQRYLMGSAAVTFATKAPHLRMFGRNAIGQGYTTYTQWSATYAWQKGALYHLDCLLDGVNDVQRCELSLDGTVVKSLEGSVPYLDPAAHLSSGFYLELGTGNPGTIETFPLGWAYSNVLVTAAVVP